MSIRVQAIALLLAAGSAKLDCVSCEKVFALNSSEAACLAQQLPESLKSSGEPLFVPVICGAVGSSQRQEGPDDILPPSVRTLILSRWQINCMRNLLASRSGRKGGTYDVQHCRMVR